MNAFSKLGFLTVVCALFACGKVERNPPLLTAPLPSATDEIPASPPPLDTEPGSAANGGASGEGTPAPSDPNEPPSPPEPPTCGGSNHDADGDGRLDCEDLCPNDALKIEPGGCGCGAIDTDSDGDAVLDCRDNCIDDALKSEPGLCGCGAADADDDGDGSPDCVDECDADPNKSAPGICGCGALDLDTDGDGAADCEDACPDDANKTADAGICGCGRLEVDSDGDGALDCEDVCPLDPDKLLPGGCGCGSPDTDGDDDGTVDCRDVCPSEADKTDPQVCGCDTPDVDDDFDGVLDCKQSCPADPAQCPATDPATKPAYVDITWLSVSNIYYELGPLRVLTDGYITRIPSSNFYGGAQGLAYTYDASVPDVAAVSRVLEALGGPSSVNLLLTGHSHFDHAFDTAAWSRLTEAPVMGSKTTCFQVRAQGIPAARCTPLNGGEVIALSEHVTLRVVRWNHSGDSKSNPDQHPPVELASVPTPDPVNGGLHAGVAEDFPNGGGGRAYLFTVDGAGGPFSWFFQNSAGTSDLAQPIIVDGVDYGAPLDNLRRAMAEASLTSVDLWIGSGGAPVARLVQPLLNARAYLPVHWDSFTASFWAGVTRGYSDSSLASYLAASGAQLLKPVQYMDKFRLDSSGVRPVANAEVKQALGFSN